MRKILAFLRGMWEFRSDFTTHYSEGRLYAAYDWGREVAHRITFRLFENS